jgi:hypothetical protein
MKRVIVLSPYKGARHDNVTYARRVLLDSLKRGEAPFASHLLYTQVLEDNIPADRVRGLSCESAWLEVADLVACYTDRGISDGMQYALDQARGTKPVEYRSLNNNDSVTKTSTANT